MLKDCPPPGQPGVPDAAIAANVASAAGTSSAASAAAPPYPKRLQLSLYRSVIGFSLLLATGFLALLVGFFWIVEDNVFNRMLAVEAKYLSQASQGQLTPAAPRAAFMQLYPGWQTLPETILRQHLAEPERVEFQLADQQTWHVRPLIINDQPWVLVADISAYEISRDHLPQLWPWLGLTLCLIGVISYALARYLSQLMVQPICQLATQIRQLQPGATLTLQHRLPDNELGYLADTITGSIGQLQAALRRESDFTRDISHELRTPVAVMALQLQQLQPAAGTDAQSVQQLQHSLKQMERIIEVLLSLARAESTVTESLCLLAATEHCLLNHGPLMRQQGLQLELQVAAGYRLQANQHLLHCLLNNLIDNASRYASPLQLRISLHGDQLCFSNPLTPDTPARPSAGIGQGLPLVQRICQLYGWQFSTCAQPQQFQALINFRP